MAERNSGWVSGRLVDATDARLATGVLIAPDGGATIRSRGGIKPSAGSPGLVRATTPTSSGSVTVQPFQGVIQGTRGAANGPYLVTLDEVKTIDVLAVAPHASDPRQDLIVAVQTDTEFGDQRSALEIRHVPGTPSSPPADPTVAGDHLLLARVMVAAGATSISDANILDLRTFTAAVGGILPVANRASRPGAPYQGQAVYAAGEGVTEVYDGTWRPIARGGLLAYGPADPDWPHLGSTDGATEFVINRVTVPAVPYARSLFVTAQVVLTAANHVGGYDLHLRTEAPVFVPPRPPFPSRIRSTMVVQPHPNDAVFGAYLSAVIEQGANRVRTLELVMLRVRGSGSMSSNFGPPYTQLNVLAFPV
jgi:hypothetical protein